MGQPVSLEHVLLERMDGSDFRRDLIMLGQTEALRITCMSYALSYEQIGRIEDEGAEGIPLRRFAAMMGRLLYPVYSKPYRTTLTVQPDRNVGYRIIRGEPPVLASGLVHSWAEEGRMQWAEPIYEIIVHSER